MNHNPIELPDVEKLIAPAGSPEFSAMKVLWQGRKIQDILEGQDVYPSQLEISLTMACNLKCIWCVDKPWREKFPGTLDAQILLQRLAEFYDLGTHSITIEGGGEPTCHPRFQQIVEEAHRMGFSLGLITNGTRMKQFISLVPLFRWIRVSLDAPNAELYLKYKGLDAFEHVLYNLNRMAEEKRRTGAGTVLGVGYLGSKEGMDVKQLAPLVYSLRSMGLSYVQFRRITEHPDLDAGMVDLSPLLKFANNSFHVYVHQLNEMNPGNMGLPCYAHRLVSVISGSGDVFFCCRLRTSENDFMGHIGNLYKQTVRDIWTSAERRKMVKNVESPQFTSHFCPECRHTKYNVVLHRLLEDQETKDFL